MGLGIGIVIFLGIIMLGVGLWSSKRVKTSDDYYVGGRSLGNLVTIGTQCATFVGGGMTLGWIGNGFKYGMGAIWYGAPQALSFFLMAAVVVKQMRKHGTSFISLPDWFDHRYQNKFLSIASAIVCLIIPIAWVTAQTTAAARMLETVGVPYVVGVLAVGGIVMIYSTVGGYLAVAYTDAVQWFILLVIFAATVPFAIIFAGGFGGVAAANTAEMMNPMTVNNMPGYTIPLWIVAGLVSGMGLQSSYQRIYSAKTDKIAKRGLVWTGIATIFFACLTAFVGLAVRALGAPGDLASDSVWPWFLNNYLPKWVAVIYTVCIMMATMSTADSMLNSISLTVTHDFYSKYINPKADDKKVLKIGIIVSGIFGILALYFATAGTWMTALFGMSYTLGAGPLAGGVLVAAFMKKKANPVWLGAGMLGGAVMGFITLKVPDLAAIPAGGTVFSFGACVIIAVIGSLIFKNKKAAAEEE